MAETIVADILHIRSRFMRSVNLERDFYDGALQDYVVTPQTKATLVRLARGLATESRQRAWRITGDYGTGKSALALVLAHLFGDLYDTLPLPLRQAVDFRRLGIRRPRLLPVLVTGSREPIVIALLRALERALVAGRIRGAKPQVLHKIRLFTRAPTQQVSDAAALELVQEANRFVCSSGKGTGLLIILDELGKFLEFTATHPESQDILFLQSLAEEAARSGNRPVFVLGLLHQGFNAYAENLSQVAQKEWEKVAGRFEELVFDQPMEQTAGLVAYALGVQTKRLSREIVNHAERDMQRAIDLGWYGPGAHQLLKETAPKLYPLHSTVLPVLVRLFSRFGQNERSLFSFLLSDEPFGLRGFLDQPIQATRFYQLHNLYDYARLAFGSRLNVQSNRSHWNQIESVVESFPWENERELQVLKTVALLNLIDSPNLLATEPVLSVVLGIDGNEGRARDTLQRLTREKHVLYHRGATGGYCLWPHTSVNLERVYKEACRAVGTPRNISSFVGQSLETRPIVARRHYIETGNLRHFEVLYTAMENLSTIDKQESERADGRIIIPLCETANERREALRFATSANIKARQDVLVAVPEPLGALAGLVQECQRWEWIAQNVPELNSDSYAAEEVSRQLEASRQMLEKRTRSYIGLRQFTETTELRWFHQGTRLPVSGGRDLLANLSRICDEAYYLAPRIQNELVNRRILSSAAAAARMRLIERILKFPTKPFLGMEPEKKPPEMSMYLSVLRQSGLHREVKDGWAILAPSSKFDPCNLRPVFDRIQELLEAKPDAKIRVSDIFSELRRRPYGLRDGMAPLLLSVFSVVHEQNIAFYENGAFLRHLSGEEFLRLTKMPTSFELQYCRIEGVRSVVFDMLRKLLLPERSSPHKSDILDVVRPLCQFAAQLPAFTHRTRTLSVEASSVRETLLHAQEPVALLFEQLPIACGFKEFKNERGAKDNEVLSFVKVLEHALADLKAAYPDLLSRMEAGVVAAFRRPGSFEEVRQSLAAVAGKLLVAVAETRLKAFCFRLADASLSENTWVESLGSLLCGKPPSKWVDADADFFQEEIKRLARQFEIVEAMAFGTIKDKDRSAVRVSITHQNGVEIDRVLYVGLDEEEKAAEIENQIGMILGRTNRVGLVAATRAIGKALSSNGAREARQ